MGAFDKAACVLLSGAIFLVAYLVRRKTGSWGAPGSLFSLFWFFYTFVPLLALLGEPANPLAVLYILAACAAFAISVQTRDWKEAWSCNSENARRLARTAPIYDSRFVTGALFASSALSLLTLVIDQRAQGFSISAIQSDLLSVAGENIARRYSGDTVATPFAQVGNVLAYVCAALGGLAVGGPHKRLMKLWVIGASFAPTVFMMAVQGAKGELFAGVAVFCGATIVRRVRSGDRRIVDRGFLIAAGLVGLVAVPALAASFMARGVGKDRRGSGSSRTFSTDGKLRVWPPLRVLRLVLRLTSACTPANIMTAPFTLGFLHLHVVVQGAGRCPVCALGRL